MKTNIDFLKTLPKVKVSIDKHLTGCDTINCTGGYNCTKDAPKEKMVKNG